jgi:uncharacterized protein (DUF1330 family)
MPAYVLFDNLEVHDPAALEEYARRVAPLVEAHGGRYVALGGPVEVLEGTWSPTFPVLIEFPSLEAARRWYSSEEYRDIKAIRLRATRSSGVLLGGEVHTT